MTPEGPHVTRPPVAGRRTQLVPITPPTPVFVALWNGEENQGYRNSPGDAMHPTPPLRPSTKGRKVPSPWNVEPALAHATTLQAAPGHSSAEGWAGPRVLD